MLIQLLTTRTLSRRHLFSLLTACSLAILSISPAPSAAPVAKATAKPQQISTDAAPKKPAVTVVASPASRNVQIYLKNGDDLKGQIVAYQPNKLFIKTGNGLKALNLNYYHGLILDTPEEHSFGNSITHKADVFEDAVEYSKTIRPLLNKQLANNLQKLPNVCKPTLYPLIHMQFDKTGKVVRSELLTRSNCPHLNLAMAQAVKNVQFPPLPKGYPINIYVFNYFFPVNLLQPATATTQTSASSPATPKATNDAKK